MLDFTLGELQMIKMAVRLGERTLETYNFSNQVINIGRDSAGDVFLDNPAISRHHCTVSVDNGIIMIKDEGSANGTYLNGTQISESVEVKNGDTIGIGKFKIVVGYTDPNKKKPIFDYGGGTLAIDSSVVQSVKNAEKITEIQKKETTPSPDPEKIVTQNTVEKPVPAPASLPPKAQQTQVFTQNMVKKTNPILYVVIGLLIGVILGFIAGLLVAQNQAETNSGIESPFIEE